MKDNDHEIITENYGRDNLMNKPANKINDANIEKDYLNNKKETRREIKVIEPQNLINVFNNPQDINKVNELIKSGEYYKKDNPKNEIINVVEDSIKRQQDNQVKRKRKPPPKKKR